MDTELKDNTTLQRAMIPTIFALLAYDGPGSFGIEKECVACLRLSLEGNRKIALTPFRQLFNFMKRMRKRLKRLYLKS